MVGWPALRTSEHYRDSAPLELHVDDVARATQQLKEAYVGVQEEGDHQGNVRDPLETSSASTIIEGTFVGPLVLATRTPAVFWKR